MTRVDTASARCAEATGSLDRTDLGFLLAKASQRWNDALTERFAASGYPDVRASYGSVLVPLFEEDGLRMGELARRAGLVKQTMTTIVAAVERAGYVRRRRDPSDGRASTVHLTTKGRRLRPVAIRVVAALEDATIARIGRSATETLRTALGSLVYIPEAAAKGP